MVIQLGKKIPINIYPSFFIMMLLMGGMISNFNIGLTLVATIVIFFSIMAHELGHALVSKKLGLKPRINLVMLGGNTISRSKRKISSMSRFLMVVCGPLMGFCLAGVAVVAIFLLKDLLVLERFSGLRFMLEITLFVNLAWTLVNLLPILPMDGGVLLNILLEHIWGINGRKATYIIGMIISTLLGLLLFSTATFMGVFFLIFAFDNYRNYRLYRYRSESDEDPRLHLKLLEIDAIDDTEKALKKIDALLTKKPTGMIRKQIFYKKAYLLSKQEQYQEAYNILLDIHKYLKGSELKFLLHLAEKVGDSKMFIRIGEDIFPNYGNAQLAYEIACHYVLYENEEAVIGWSRIAIERGLSISILQNNTNITRLAKKNKSLYQLLNK